MHHISSASGRLRALAPAAALLLALCLLATGVQALTDPMDTAALADANATIESTPIQAPAASALTPYPGTHPVPGLVQAEDFDAGGEGVAYHDTEPANLGGAYRPAEGVDIETAGLFTDVGWIRTGEWLTYTVNTNATQSFVLDLRASNPDTDEKRVYVLVNGEFDSTVSVPPTGSFENFTTVTSTPPFTLPMGESTVRLSLNGANRINLDRLEFRLAPPPTPTPTPTPTLNQTPALTISVPGRYTLDHDLSGEMTGVLIASSDVVLDGMGHSITGTGSHTAFERGVFIRDPSAGAPISNVTVRNLTVRGWSRGLDTINAADTQIEDVLSEQNVEGLVLHNNQTDHVVVRSSTFRDNVDYGIGALGPGAGLAITGCSVTGNVAGILLMGAGSPGDPAVLEGNDVSGNRNTGIGVGGTATIRNNTVRGNGGNGIRLELGRAVIEGNRIEGNAGAGIDASSGTPATITGNRIAGNAPGIAGSTSGGAAPLEAWNNELNNSVNADFPVGGAVPQLNVTKTAGPNVIGGPQIGGNFWAKPDGTGFSQTHPDTNGDGFCDEPYPVTEDAVDYLPLALQNATPTPTPTPPFGGSPYRPLSIPGRIQAEDYNLGGEGVAYHDTTPGNSGGAYRADDVDIEVQGGVTNVGWIRNGEYLTYTANVTTAGTYTMTARVASPNSGRTVAVAEYGTTVATITVPNTGSFAAFRDVEVPITLGAGTHALRLTFAGDGQHLDWIAFAVGGVTTTSTPTPTPGAGGASFVAVPTTAPHGSAVKFTVTPATGKSISAASWSFDAPAHLNTWNSRAVDPTFFYPVAGTFSPLVKIIYTDGSIETIERSNYIRAT